MRRTPVVAFVLMLVGCSSGGSPGDRIDGLAPSDAASVLDAAVVDGAATPPPDGASIGDLPPPCGGKCTDAQRCACGTCIAASTPLLGAEGQPTKDPIGGGIGYSKILSPPSGSAAIATRAELLDALKNAKSGSVVHVAGSAEIDLSGSQNITIPAGVTLASDRGRGGSKGALLWTSQVAFPFFVAGGADVRVTGLRIQGPDPDVRDHDYDSGVGLCRGVQSKYPSLEVDNCELSGWSHAAVYLDKGAVKAHIHHNYIHHNKRAGYGYGVSHAYSDATSLIDSLIEANLFDHNRHDVAATGEPYGSYEARYNLTLEHAEGHRFDRHGNASGQAGDWTRLHHNTVWDTDNYSVYIRGKPVKGAEIHHNWFFPTPESEAVVLASPTNVSVHDNQIGATTPAGTCLPQAKASAAPLSGKAPLTVAFDGSQSSFLDGAILSHVWDFGDGTSAEGAKKQKTFAAPGRYLVSLTVADNRGVRQREFLPITVSPADSSKRYLDFWVKDSAHKDLPGYYLKQAFIDNTKVWEADVAGKDDWQHVSVDVTSLVAGKAQVQVKLRAYAAKAVTDKEAQFIEVYTRWDDVVLFGGELKNGDFEASGSWTYSEQGDAEWAGNRCSAEVRSGNRAYYLRHNYDTTSVAGSFAQIAQTVTLISP